MDDSITYQTVVVLNVSRLSGKEYKERGQNLNSDTPAKFVVFYLLGEGENENVRILSN